MFSKYKDTLTFSSLKEFLVIRNEYSLSWKRKLLNLVVSLSSIFYIKIRPEVYDVIFILPSPHLSFRYGHIIDMLDNMNLKSKMVFYSNRDIIKLSIKGAVCTPYHFNSHFAIEKGFAAYLKQKHEPKIIFQAGDCNYVSTFLKRFSGAKLVNIAHCVSCASGNFDVFDYHYYFIFGDSSEQNLRKIAHSYGSTQLIKMGSLFLINSADLTSQSHPTTYTFEKHIVFSSQWMARGIEEYVQWSRELIVTLAERNPKLKITIKCHPLEADRTWIKELPNLFIAFESANFRELLSDASFHLTHHSAFALESSVCNVPTICIQKEGFKDPCLSFENYFPIVNNIVQLEKLLLEGEGIFYDPSGFAKFHLANIDFERDVFRETVSKVLKGYSLENEVLLAGTHLDSEAC